MKTASVRDETYLEKQSVARLSGHIIRVDGCRNHVLVLVDSIPRGHLRLLSRLIISTDHRTNEKTNSSGTSQTTQSQSNPNTRILGIPFLRSSSFLSFLIPVAIHLRSVPTPTQCHNSTPTIKPRKKNSAKN